jgi:hypothetical protein
LGKKSLGTDTFPPMGTALIDGDIAFRQHEGGHTPGPNWPTFLEFAGRYLHGPGVTSSSASADPTPPAPPVHLTAEQDRRRMLVLLGLTEAQLRPRPDGDAASPGSTNYDESKANIYPRLPDPLVMNDGKPVTTAAMWLAQRRPEIVADFNREILGRAPPGLPSVTWQTVSSEEEQYEGVPVVTRRLLGHVDNSSYPLINVTIDMIVTTPARAAGPVPIVMELAFAKDYEDALAHPGRDPELSGPGRYGVPWKPVLDRGWGFAVLSPTSYQADDGAGLTEGIIGLMNKGQPRRLDDWGALRAWAWGASRALDYLATDPTVDANQVALAGHSRFGKTALVAMAYDPRFAVAYISSSGEGGAKLYRHIYGEQMQNLAGPALYQWFAGNFLRYAGPLNPGDLPVDNHELIALCAPRPVFIGGGSNAGDGYANPKGDAWADPRGMFLAEVAADPVYRLLGSKGLGVTAFPPIQTALIDGDLGFRQHAEGHTPVPNWPAFLEFASHYLHAPQSQPVLARKSPPRA